MILVKQSSAAQPLEFLLTLASDHVTGATGLTPTVTITKNGSTFAAPAGAVSEIANGKYQVAGNATDTNTLGPIWLHATAGTADPCDRLVAQVVAFDPQATDMGITETAEAYAGKTGQSKLLSMMRLVVQAIMSSTWTPGVSTGTFSVIGQDGSTVKATSTGNDPVNPTSTLRAT